MMKKYYFVYDMSPLEKEGQDYIQIAFGPKNPNNVIRDQAYNTDSSYYNPSEKQYDSS